MAKKKLITRLRQAGAQGLDLSPGDPLAREAAIRIGDLIDESVVLQARLSAAQEAGGNLIVERDQLRTEINQAIEKLMDVYPLGIELDGTLWGVVTNVVEEAKRQKERAEGCAIRIDIQGCVPLDVDRLARAVHEAYRRSFYENVSRDPNWDDAKETIRATRLAHAGRILYLLTFEEIPEAPTADMKEPCQHPNRDGDHEVYWDGDERTFCRACGAEEISGDQKPGPHSPPPGEGDVMFWHDANGSIQMVRVLALPSDTGTRSVHVMAPDGATWWVCEEHLHRFPLWQKPHEEEPAKSSLIMKAESAYGTSPDPGQGEPVLVKDCGIEEAVEPSTDHLRSPDINHSWTDCPGLSDLELQALAAVVYSDAVKVASINARYPSLQQRTLTDGEFEAVEVLKEELERRGLMTT